MNHEKAVKAYYPLARLVTRSQVRYAAVQGHMVMPPTGEYFVVDTDGAFDESCLVASGETARKAWRKASRNITRSQAACEAQWNLFGHAA